MLSISNHTFFPLRGTWKRVFVWTALSVILALSVVQRIFPATEFVYPESGETRLLGADSYYYLRHSVYFAETISPVSESSSGASFRARDPGPANSLFVIVIGAVSMLIGAGNPSLDLVMQVSAWTPVILGMASYLLVFLLGRALGGPFLGLLSALLYLVFPATALNRSLLGFADHHVVETLLVLAILFGWIRTIQKSREDLPARSWRPAFLLGAPYYLFFFTWAGAPIYAVIFTIVIIVLASYLTAAGQSLQVFAHGCFRFFAPHIVVFSLVWLLVPNLIILEPLKYRSLILFSGVGLALGPYIIAWAVEIIRRRGFNNIAVGGGLAVISLGALAVFFFWTDFGASTIAPVIGEKSESIREQEVFSFGRTLQFLGSTGLLTLIAIPLVAITSWRQENTEEKILAVLLGSIMMYVWWSAHDYDYIPPPLTALAGGLGLWIVLKYVLHIKPVQSKETTRKNRSKKGKRKKTPVRKKSAFAWINTLWLRRSVAFVLFAVFVFGAWWPLGYARPWMPATTMRSLFIYTEGWFEAMSWMRENTADPYASSAAGDESSRYRVLAAWDYGNVISSIGGRIPVYAQSFDTNEGRFFSSASEDEAISRLCPKCGVDESVPYVIADARTAGDIFAMKARYGGHEIKIHTEGTLPTQQDGRDVPHATLGALFDDSIISRLYMKDGVELQRFRLLYESPEQSYVAYQGTFGQLTAAKTRVQVQRHTSTLDKWVDASLYRRMAQSSVVRIGDSYLYDQKIASTVKIFELVKGVEVSGDLDPGSKLTFQLPLYVSTTGREFTYNLTAFADSTGHIQLTLPYSSERDTTRVVSARSPYVASYYPDPSVNSTSYARLDLSDSVVVHGSALIVSYTNQELTFSNNE